MDPNETLRLLREAVKELEYNPGGVTDLFEALDEGLSKGGFPPEAWAWPFTKAALHREIYGRPGTAPGAGAATGRMEVQLPPMGWEQEETGRWRPVTDA